jgi:hypothetical protein
MMLVHKIIRKPPPALPTYPLIQHAGPGFRVFPPRDVAQARPFFTQLMYAEHMHAYGHGFKERGYITSASIPEGKLNIFNLRCVVYMPLKIPEAFYWYPAQYTSRNLPKNIFFFGMIDRRISVHNPEREPVWCGWDAIADLRLVSQEEFDALLRHPIENNGITYTYDYVQNYSERNLERLRPRAVEEWNSFEERPA